MRPDVWPGPLTDGVLKKGALVQRLETKRGDHQVVNGWMCAQARGRAWLSAALLALLVIPWINPFSRGPSSSVGPWLVSAICAAIAFVGLPAGRANAVLGAVLVAVPAWAFLTHGVTPDGVALAAACLLILMSAWTAAGSASRPQFIRLIALGWLLAAVLSTAIALVQYFGLSDRFAPWVNPSAIGEPFANLRQRNQFATLTVIGMASILWALAGGPRRWPIMVAIAVLAIGNAATASRAGLVEMLLLGLLAFAWPGRRPIGLWLLAACVYLAAALALPWLLEWSTGVVGSRLWERLGATEGCSSRKVLWSNVIELIGLKPWLGWGWGDLDYAHFTTLYPGSRFCDILDNAHSLPLHLAVELGLPVAVLLCAGLAWAAVRAMPWREANPARQLAWAVLAVILVHSMLEYPLWYGPFQIALGLCLGLLWPAARSSTDLKPMRAPTAAVLAMVAVAACSYAAWDFWRVSQVYRPYEERSESYRDDPIARTQSSWLFRSHVRFAELTLTPLTRANAQWTYDMSMLMLHHSPEPRVVEKLIESASMLSREEEALAYLARFRAAFPREYAQWARRRN
jgi:O-antigen ligase